MRHKNVHHPMEFPRTAALVAILREAETPSGKIVRAQINPYLMIYGQAKKSATKFLEQNPVEGNECDICQIVNLLIHSNWTLAFQGDSLSRQTFSSLECEL